MLSAAGYATGALRQVAPRQRGRAAAERPGLRRVVRHPAHDGRGLLAVVAAGCGAGVVPFPHRSWRARKGETSRELEVYDLEQRRLIDAEITRRTVDFMRAQRRPGSRSSPTCPTRCVHFPTLPHPAFAGQHRPRRLRRRARRDGRERRHAARRGRRARRSATTRSWSSPATTGRRRAGPWHGSAGPWRGSYFTAHGGRRCACRSSSAGRAGSPPAGSATRSCTRSTPSRRFAAIAGAEVPADRPIDGVDQTDFLLGQDRDVGPRGVPGVRGGPAARR